MLNLTTHWMGAEGEMVLTKEVLDVQGEGQVLPVNSPKQTINYDY